MSGENCSLLPEGITPLENQGGGHMFGAKNGMLGIMVDVDGRLLKPLSATVSVNTAGLSRSNLPSNEVLSDGLPSNELPNNLLPSNKLSSNELHNVLPSNELPSHRLPSNGGGDDTRGELHFYQNINLSSDPIDRRLLRLVPSWHGVKTVNIGGAEVSCLVLDNLTHGLRHACVLDLKIGSITTTPHAPLHKQLHEASKYRKTRDALGFSVPGMVFYDLLSESVVRRGKTFGKSLDESTVLSALCHFLNAEFSKPLALDVCRTILQQLTVIRRWFKDQHRYHFYASSILLLYDAALMRQAAVSGTPGLAAGSSEVSDTTRARGLARMIDFAYVCPSDGSSDANYTRGLDGVIGCLKLVASQLGSGGDCTKSTTHLQ